MVLAFVQTREPTMTDPTTRQRVQAIAHWLAHQRAAPSSQTESIAWRIIEEARDRGLALDGARAPLVVQARFSLWLVGQLAGRPLMRVFADREAAVHKARELSAELRVPVLVIDSEGDIERLDPVAPAAAAAPPPVVERRPEAVVAPEPPPPLASVAPAEPLAAPRLVVDRFEDRWAVFVAGRVIATAPTRERARQRARVLKADPDFMADPQPIRDPETEDGR
ncbi:MAG: hypothetical protein IT385_08020 [Deltaproteobacteria bacterium]|nr:hypothetical protein [Deltaproteobacteria bacterium]